MSNKKIEIDALSEAIYDIMQEYGESIALITAEGVTQAAEELKRDEIAATPIAVKPEHRRKLEKGWRLQKGKRWKIATYVGNSVKVPSKGGETSLLDILEYSTTRGKPFAKRTFEQNADKYARIILNKIKKEA